MPEVQVGYVGTNIKTYYEATCDRCDWLSVRFMHVSDAWGAFTAHNRLHHQDVVHAQKYKRTVIYELVDGAMQESEIETSELEIGESNATR